MSTKFIFCSGSRTSSKALAGSPWRLSLVILSNSSSKNKGLTTSAFFIPLIILPGIEPKYVFLCPRISDSSWTPPRDILTNFLFKASAIDLASVDLPTPGGPTKQMIGDLEFGVLDLTAKYSIIRSFTFSKP